jgi:hypothetical protein
MIQAEGVVSYRRFEDADELGALVADDLALLLTDRFASVPAAHRAAPLPAMRVLRPRPAGTDPHGPGAGG